MCQDLGKDYIIYEKENDIFLGASSHNQNRLHLGFHYPRSFYTRLDSRMGFNDFTKQFPFMVADIEKNLYAVHKNSIIDFNTYKRIFRAEEYQFTEYEKVSWTDAFEGIIGVDEKYIDFLKARDYFKKSKLKIKFNSQLSFRNEAYYLNGRKINSQHTIINCSYGGLMTPKIRELYRIESFVTYLVDIKCKVPFGALTVMDGPFYSIYPYKNSKNTFTLTHVKYGPLKINSKKNILQRFEMICSEVENDMKFLKDQIKYKGYFISEKLKRKNGNDDYRSVDIISEFNQHFIVSGKIDTVFKVKSLINEL